MADSGFWVSVLQIIAIDILLGGDNAVVIALACRRLPPKQRNQGIFWGVFGAIALRLVLIFFALQLLMLPFLKLAGGLLLLWIGIKLLQPEPESRMEEDAVDAPSHLWGAVKTIIIADAVMSLDNVIGVAAAADGDIRLVAFGILVSIPIIVWGSKLVLMLMDRFPVIITLGGGLLGWIGGEMLVTDVALETYLHDMPHWVHYLSATTGALFVIAVGTLLAQRTRPRPLKEVASDRGEQGSDNDG